MTRHILVLGVLCILGSGWAGAQQPMQYSLFNLNKYAFNPAYAGLDGSVSITGVYRQQWAGLPGAPSSQHLNVHSPVEFLSSGFGINIENDEIGAHRQTSAFLTYAYYLRVAEEGVLSLGLSGGIIQQAFDGSKLRAPGGIYNEPNFTHNDQLLAEGNVSANTVGLSAGLYFRSPGLQLGLGILNVNEPAINYEFTDSDNYKYIRNYFVNASYEILLGESFTLTPSVLVKTDLVETQAEATLELRFVDNIFGGGGLRGYNEQTIDAVVLFAGLRLNDKFTVAYAYDLNLSDLSATNTGSHEILLNFNLNKPIGKGRLPQIIYNPRFL